MAAASTSGSSSSFLLLLLLPLVSSIGDDPLALLDRQAAQLNRLETLIESLSRTVSTLESSLSACPAAQRSGDPRTSDQPISNSVPGTPVSAAVLGGDRAAPGVAVTKHKPSWSDQFQFAAAARLESEATCGAVLPYKDIDGLSKYFAVGDTRGRVHIFTFSGEVLTELPAISDSPVTSIVSYLSFRKNESLFFTGHADGSIAALRLRESGDDWLTLSLGSSGPFVSAASELDSPPVMGLEVHQVGRTRYVLAMNGSGRIRVFTENGTLHWTVIASSRPLAFMKQRLLFLTETGAGSLNLRSMAVKETECEGLNGSVVKSYSFDGLEPTKAYGFTAGGNLIHIILLGDVANLKCRVRSIRKSEIKNPVSIQIIKGYLLVVSLDKVYVYNVSSRYYGRVGAPRPLFVATFQEIKSQFLNNEAPANEFSAGKPLIAIDREKLLVLGLGDGYIGIYRANFPVLKVESIAMVWSAPAVLFFLFLIMIWQLYVKKKDALWWAQEESFNVPSTSSGSLLGPPPGDRSYVDTSRAADLREVRGNSRRGPTRRYVSPPSRYPGGSGIPFRPTSADPGFRGTADLKYIGKNTEILGLPKRREHLFSNNQAVDDHID